MSSDYHVQLERGYLRGVSASVLNAVANALQFDDAEERAHLFDLARAANASSGKPRRASTQKLCPGVQRLLDAITNAPAWVRNGRANILATNRLGRALYTLSSMTRSVRRTPLGFTFLNSRATQFYRDWEGTARDMVAGLRAQAGRSPYDRGLTGLVGELSTRSETFRTLWASHDVLFHRTGHTRLHHPVVGGLDLTYEAFELLADPGLTVLVYTAEPATPTADALNLLASLGGHPGPGGPERTGERADDERAAHTTDEP